MLVQPLLEPAFGGVTFGIDPVSGRSDRRIISAVRGAPEPLVSGQVEGSRYVLDASGKVLRSEANDGPRLHRGDLRRLLELSNEVAAVFGGPQNVEWAIGADGQQWLLQSSTGDDRDAWCAEWPDLRAGARRRDVPEPLTELERDLWVPPLRRAVREAVLLAGAATAAEVDRSEVVVSVDGHVAIDLLWRGDPRKRGVGQRLNPVAASRHVGAAWRIGRLRAALPKLAERLLDQADRDLETIPNMGELTSRQLIALMRRGRKVLRALHAHEILIGMLTDTARNRLRGASVALRVLVEARRDGHSNDEILDASPVVLAFTPPRVAPRPVLPAASSAIDLGPDPGPGDGNGIVREALRLRVRWIQEVTGRAAWELGERLAAAGDLTEPALIRHMDLDHVEAVATKRAVVVPSLVASHEHDFGAPLPAWFRLTDLGKPMPVQCAAEIGGGTGAGGGSSCGPISYDTDDPPDRSVLVTTTLTPGLAPLLPRLNGIVAETGSVLSHLAILAREAGVATVVGYQGAMTDLPEGAVTCVDGNTGLVTIQDKEGSP